MSVPATSNPLDPPTVSRLANIPHGTTIVAQGIAFQSNGTPPFAPASIIPFTIAPPNTPINFPEMNLGVPTTFRTLPGDIPNVTQAMVNNPNVVLAAGVAGKQIQAVTTLRISTTPLIPPPSGGGTSNICFLQGTAGGPNAQSVKVDAIFWIEDFLDEHGNPKTQLQYSQSVLLNFNVLSRPHVSVATMLKD